MKDLYLTLFHALTKGNYKDGKSSLINGKYGAGSDLIYSYPSQLASEYSISICRAMEIELKKIVEMLFPTSYTNVANEVISIGVKGEIAKSESIPTPPTVTL